MRYQVMGMDPRGRIEVVKFEGTADSFQQMLAIAINLFNVDSDQWIVDENGYTVEDAQQARYLWDRTAIDEMREAIRDQ